MPRNQIQKSLFALLLGSMFLTGCGVPNPFCGSARPVPVMSSLAPDTATFAQIQLGLLVTVNGSHFYSESTILWNGAALSSTVISGTQLQATVTTNQMPAPGSAQVVVHTPPNLSGDFGCDSGGDSKASTFTVSEWRVHLSMWSAYSDRLDFLNSQQLLSPDYRGYRATMFRVMQNKSRPVTIERRSLFCVHYKFFIP